MLLPLYKLCSSRFFKCQENASANLVFVGYFHIESMRENLFLSGGHEQDYHNTNNIVHNGGGDG